jgi:hypothetical protein
MRDVIGHIAHARAAMLMRGYEPLRVEMGQKTFYDLRMEMNLDMLHAGPPEGQIILGMPIRVRADMEGFSVLHDPGT